MAGLKDIKRRIKSVGNTKKITYAMKLVSAAKLRKAQDAVKSAREYTDTLGQLVAQVLAVTESSELTHPLMEERSQVARVRLVVVGGSRGLCGAFNSNVNKQIERSLTDLRAEYPNAKVDTYVLGKKPREFVERSGIESVRTLDALPESALDWPIDEIAQDLENAFLTEEVDRVYVLYMRFQSAMSQTPTLEQILPLQAILASEGGEEDAAPSLTLFEPSAEKVFESLVPRILRTQIQQAALDTKASEHGSRMVAMDSATKNAGELGRALTLKHNKLRQGAITSELLDIIGGAEALND
ncbi:ATP synthase F1 subunit gamma [bacterium]|nr:ATP synthase F1 subunit gamma [bacterium]